MSETDLKQPTFLDKSGSVTVLVIRLLKTKKEVRNKLKEEIQIIFTRMILTKFVFNMMWIIVNINIWLKEHRVFRDKAFKIAINTKYDGYQRGIASMAIW